MFGQWCRTVLINMNRKPLSQEQRDYLKPALDKLEAAFDEVHAHLRRLPPDGDPQEQTGCLRCECAEFKGSFSRPCTNTNPATGRPCGHRASAHSDFM